LKRSNCVAYALTTWLLKRPPEEERYLLIRRSRVAWGFFHCLSGSLDKETGQIRVTSYKPPPGHKKTGFAPFFHGSVVDGDRDPHSEPQPKRNNPKEPTMPLLTSILRGLPRILLLTLLAQALLFTATAYPLLLGANYAPILFGLGICFTGLAAGDLALRILQPQVDPQLAAKEAMTTPNGAGLVYLGRSILAAVILMLVVTASRAGAEPPVGAIPYLPILSAQTRSYWPAMPLPSALGAQVEQETCISLRSRGCWNPKAELRTSREQGVGLGQLTRAFRANGATRFDALSELTTIYKQELNGLTWDNRFDPTLQLRALVLKNKQGFDLIGPKATVLDRLAMSFAAYNGGLGGLNSDRRACAGTPGCDPSKWFGHVEHTSLKAKAAVPGYGKSFFAINREYVTNIMVVRRVRYLQLDLV
jgi:hypothetical protein